MKILYCADMHGDLNSLKKFRDFGKNNADVIVCAGDLISLPLNEKYMQQLGALTRSLLTLRENQGITDHLEEMVIKLQEIKDCPDEIKQAAKRYSRLHNLAKGKTKKQYENIKEIFDSFNVPVLTIPGNWDTRNIDNILNQENLHDKYPVEINKVNFGGYGASGESMMGVLPLDLEIPFHEKEVYSSLCKWDPDVAVVHCPPYKILDKTIRNQHAGYLGILAYLLDEQPNLLLVGHIHEAIGVETKNLTTVINPGNLGRSEFHECKGRPVENYGTFMEIYTDDKNYFKEANLRSIKEKNKVVNNYTTITKNEI